MEMDEIQNQGCKFPRISNGNGRFDNKRDGQDDGLEVKRISTNGLGGLCGGWPSSRIVRVSRASGGKDRHSKVWTSKGLRDRRVRLSVNTAIQFYDLQDRLGYDQPSKAVEWLLKAAAPSISELPSLNGFPDIQREISEDKRSSTGTHEQGLDSAEVEIDAGDPNCNQQQQLSKSACSSTSETSKGSALSLSRSESRVKARERARERAAEKEKEKENVHSSFTELLTGGMNNNNNNNVNTTSNNGRSSETNFFCKSPRQWSASPFEYFSSGLLGPRGNDNSTSSFPTAQIHLGNPIQQPLSMSSSPMFSISGDHHHHPELHHFPFVNDHLVVPVVSTGCGTCNGHANKEYNLNFSISSSSSSGLAGYSRGTLQSNSSSLLPHFQRYSPIEGTQSFFNATTANTAAAAAAAVVAASVDDHHHNFLSAYDARLQLFYGDEHGRDHKGKGKN